MDCRDRTAVAAVCAGQPASTDCANARETLTVGLPNIDRCRSLSGRKPLIVSLDNDDPCNRALLCHFLSAKYGEMRSSIYSDSRVILGKDNRYGATKGGALPDSNALRVCTR